MKSLGYDISEVGLCAPTAVLVSSTHGPLPFLGLYVRETNRAAHTEQLEMSQGMFRALSLLVNLNFATLELNPSCILIDDIGEGLDFERSCALIGLLRARAANRIQLIMTTNDRFVMNNVPLNAWTLLRRNGAQCEVRNYENSRETFDEFAFTGLNNFDFFSTDFVHSSDEVHES